MRANAMTAMAALALDAFLQVPGRHGEYGAGQRFTPIHGSLSNTSEAR
jgi:hypothetical protein